ncbi:MAG: RagB/SusD family nutrient uptake outer membrane protein, partial [Prevotella sp.]|nr:RagB/SusD family nutrient uptake outer membrane protein [Prevotella sp.]MBQ6031395.1 RagB/SusD family nutrient uptake outer membrane protein [Prevotella sp.]MBQ6659281.1 RagB/SusD family nutrient uptake outer membrane protein [Prevotella sp.]
MKRNKIFSTVAGLALMMAATGCSDFTDLQPKGKNLLSTTEQLEMLLNTDQGYYSGVSSSGRDMRIMSGDIIYAYSNVFTTLAQPNKTRTTIMWTWDESMQDRMAELSNDDEQYAGYYGIIGRICNPILSRIDEAEGPDNVKAQLKAEALALRAYYHFLLVNKYCKGYSPANADKPGIIYMTEDVDIQVPQEKKSLQECYDLMLKDIDEAIALNALIGRGSNPMRIGQAGAYA